ncbi:hypothetical protein OHA98_09680 [Streptomyces sp. NBC_00654]|nr:hypothetical protein [Streptomyces sp. NBC_00654]MCX4965093.1 hypothetical protein [Streptomyces sp. NBC_00654]
MRDDNAAEVLSGSRDAAPHTPVGLKRSPPTPDDAAGHQEFM